MVRRVGFRLTKWYLDAIGDDGVELRIGYAAELEAGALRQRYASLLSRSTARPPRSHTRLRPARLPEQRGDVVEWAVAGLEVAGRWSAAAPAFEPIELLDQPGALTWWCVQPRAHVELTHARRRLRGTGYVERVELRVPPWQLPLDELRWGRAHISSDTLGSDTLGSHTLVWIDWRGPRRQTRVMLDGVAVEGVVADDAVVTPRLRVLLERRATLRDGDVASTAFARVPAVRALLARNKLVLRETKWLSRATAADQSGWAIHEVVRWQ